VKELEERWGSEWRKGDTERRFFSNRRVVLDEVRRIAAEQKILEVEAVEILERKRLSISATCSLDRLRKVIRDGK
jgi:Transcriptional activator of glycolytic enzymes